MLPDTPPLLSNIIADRALCVEWAQATGLLERLASNNPLIRINEMTVRQYLDRAIGFLIQEGMPVRDIWGLEDLVSPTAFGNITRSALAQSPGAARCMAIVLLTIAQEWIGIDVDHVHRLKDLAARLPQSNFSRRATARRSRINVLNARANVSVSVALKTLA